MSDGLANVLQFLRQHKVSRNRIPEAISDATTCREWLNELEKCDPNEYGTLLTTLIDKFAVWFPTEVYAKVPVLLPHVMRDNECRKQVCNAGHRKTAKGRIGESRDLWSTPSPSGYLRDDNSLIKNLASSLDVAWASPGTSIGARKRNYVACHVWPMKTATDPWLNSFIPNLVWLPKPLDVLSDHEGHVVQVVLRARAQAQFDLSHRTATELWKALPRVSPTEGAPLQNTFRISPSWIEARVSKIERIAKILEMRAAGHLDVPSSGHSHYDLHVAELAPREVRTLADRLSNYRSQI